MRINGLKTILLFLSLGLFAIWFLEFRRTTLADSYWILLLALVGLMSYQLINLKQAGQAKQVNSKEEHKVAGNKKAKQSGKKNRKR